MSFFIVGKKPYEDFYRSGVVLSGRGYTTLSLLQSASALTAVRQSCLMVSPDMSFRRERMSYVSRGISITTPFVGFRGAAVMGGMAVLLRSTAWTEGVVSGA